MARSASKHPTELELMILKILWHNGPATVRAVRDAMADQRDLAYNTVMTTMNKMIEKEYLERAKQDGNYVYRPRVNEQATVGDMLRDLVDRAFDGSAMAVMINLLGNSNIENEINQLRMLINRKAEEKSP